MKIRFYFGLLFLLLQIGLIAYARLIPERFFCWAPYDSHTKFEVLVTINQNTLSLQETEARYRYKMNGWEQRSIHNIFSIITQYEQTYGKDDNAKVVIKYSSNGHNNLEWNYIND